MEHEADGNTADEETQKAILELTRTHGDSPTYEEGETEQVREARDGTVGVAARPVASFTIVDSWGMQPIPSDDLPVVDIPQSFVSEELPTSAPFASAAAAGPTARALPSSEEIGRVADWLLSTHLSTPNAVPPVVKPRFVDVDPTVVDSPSQHISNQDGTASALTEQDQVAHTAPSSHGHEHQ